MNDNNLSDDELEDELEKALKTNREKNDVFSIIRKEKESLESRDKRIKKQFKY
ncbi:MAG: hypothetical protein ACFE9Z_17215 [Promethearchaeota archaeon]